MTWSAPITFADNTPLYAAQMNTYLRDNLMETMVAKATTEGAWFMTDGPNRVVERIPTVGRLSTSGDTTSSTSYADLDNSSGPSITVDTGSQALVIMSLHCKNDGGGGAASGSLMSVQIDGASTIAATDNYMVEVGAQAATYEWGLSNLFFARDLTSGTNIFTAKYRVTGGIMTVGNATLIVVPF